VLSNSCTDDHTYDVQECYEDDDDPIGNQWDYVQDHEYDGPTTESDSGDERGPYYEDNTDEDDLRYLRVQEEMYKKCFNLKALTDSVDLQSFLTLIPQYTQDETIMATVLAFKRKAGLSRQAGNELLTVIQSFKPRVEVPNDWRTIQYHVEKKCNHLKATTLRRFVPFPASWRFDMWDQQGTSAPADIELIGRDPLHIEISVSHYPTY
jgi:hypothetical protein